MCKTADDKFKFSFAEMISASSGKTSATGTIGVFLCLLSMVMIAAVFLFYFFNLGEATHVLEFLDKAIIILGIGSALLGCRRISGCVNAKAAGVVKQVEDIMQTE